MTLNPPLAPVRIALDAFNERAAIEIDDPLANGSSLSFRLVLNYRRLWALYKTIGTTYMPAEGVEVKLKFSPELVESVAASPTVIMRGIDKPTMYSLRACGHWILVGLQPCPFCVKPRLQPQAAAFAPETPHALELQRDKLYLFLYAHLPSIDQHAFAAHVLCKCGWATEMSTTYGVAFTRWVGHVSALWVPA